MFIRMYPSKGQDKAKKKKIEEKPNRTVSNLNCCSLICSFLKYFNTSPILIASN